MWHHIAVILGLTDASGGWYLWWSGVGANFNPDPAIWFGIFLWWRHHTCHEHRCHRLAKYQSDDGKPFCKRHHS